MHLFCLLLVPLGKLLFILLKDFLEDYSHSCSWYYYEFTSCAGLGQSHSSASLASSPKTILTELLGALNKLIDIKGLEDQLRYGALVTSTSFPDSYHKLRVFNYFSLTSAKWGKVFPHWACFCLIYLGGTGRASST